MKKQFFLTIVLTLLGVGTLFAQNKVALKTNLLHDATASVNLGVELGIAPKWTVQLSGSYNGWTVNDMRWRHALVEPEVRWWACERFSGFFVGAHLLGGTAAVGNVWDFSQYGTAFPNLKDYLLNDAMLFGGGAVVGYDLVLGRHWNLEFELGVGYLYVTGDEYRLSTDADGKRYLPAGAQPVLKGSIFDYVGPTKLSVTISYLF